MANDDQVNHTPTMDLAQAAALPLYDGKTDLKQWLNTVVAASRLANWQDKTAVNMAIFRLTGKAQQYVIENDLDSKCATLRELGEKLAEQFIRTEPISESMQKFILARQKPGETARDFATRVKSLGLLTMRPTENNEQKQFQETQITKDILNQFITGLLPTIKPFVQVAAPGSLSEAIGKAEIFQASTVTEVPAFATKPLNTVEDEVDKLAEAVCKKLELNSRSRPRTTESREPRRQSPSPRFREQIREPRDNVYPTPTRDVLLTDRSYRDQSSYRSQNSYSRPSEAQYSRGRDQSSSRAQRDSSRDRDQPSSRVPRDVSRDRNQSPSRYRDSSFNRDGQYARSDRDYSQRGASDRRREQDRTDFSRNPEYGYERRGRQPAVQQCYGCGRNGHIRRDCRSSFNRSNYNQRSNAPAGPRPNQYYSDRSRNPSSSRYDENRDRSRSRPRDDNNQYSSRDYHSNNQGNSRGPSPSR